LPSEGLLNRESKMHISHRGRAIRGSSKKMGSGTLISEPYLSFVRQQPCVWCSKSGPSDPDHIRARGWREPKRNDYATLPSCRQCHSMRHQIGFAAMLEAKNMKVWQLLEYQACLLVEFFEKRCDNHLEGPPF